MNELHKRYIRRYYASTSNLENISSKIGCTVNAIRIQAHLMGIKRGYSMRKTKGNSKNVYRIYEVNFINNINDFRKENEKVIKSLSFRNYGTKRINGKSM